MSLQQELLEKFPNVQHGVHMSGTEGYWSNLSGSENKKLLAEIDATSARTALKKFQPSLERVIYSSKRPAGLELLDLKGDEVCIDYGCMWGALTIPLSRRTQFVLGVDQTYDSLRFLSERRKEDGAENVSLLNHDIREMPNLNHKADVALVNGVLEWVPEEGEIELKTFFGKAARRKCSRNPGKVQRDFLKGVARNLNSGGKLYLAIENRYDLKMFLGQKDPHAALLLTSILPRFLANWISKIRLRRPYVNWLYSFRSIERLLKRSGFSSVDLYMCFPDYRFPEQIFPYMGKDLKGFRSIRGQEGVPLTVKQRWYRKIENLVFGVLRLKFFAPSIIAIARK